MKAKCKRTLFDVDAHFIKNELYSYSTEEINGYLFYIIDNQADGYVMMSRNFKKYFISLEELREIKLNEILNR